LAMRAMSDDVRDMEVEELKPRVNRAETRFSKEVIHRRWVIIQPLTRGPKIPDFDAKLTFLKRFYLATGCRSAPRA
jgi:hypothetical protein